MIMNRTLCQGASLNVPEIAERYEMSITPIREAIRRLESEGLLEVLPRRGTFVRSFSVEDLISAFEVAEAYEGMAAYLVAEQVEQGADLGESLEVLAGYVDQMAEHLEQDGASLWANLDARLHESLCQMSRNTHIWQSYQMVRAQMDCVLWFITPLHVDRNNSTQEHKSIVEAVLRGEKEMARILSQKHRSLVRGVLRSLAPPGGKTSSIT
ncbi:GntR family transcriptional regulator [Betaproteobacteria bacterium]|nr:GntR family transcriptional regulator [Betaproteobacteria bacterium]